MNRTFFAAFAPTAAAAAWLVAGRLGLGSVRGTVKRTVGRCASAPI